MTSAENKKIEDIRLTLGKHDYTLKSLDRKYAEIHACIKDFNKRLTAFMIDHEATKQVRRRQEKRRRYIPHNVSEWMMLLLFCIFGYSALLIATGNTEGVNYIIAILQNIKNI